MQQDTARNRTQNEIKISGGVCVCMLQGGVPSRILLSIAPPGMPSTNASDAHRRLLCRQALARWGRHARDGRLAGPGIATAVCAACSTHIWSASSLTERGGVFVLHHV